VSRPSGKSVRERRLTAGLELVNHGFRGTTRGGASVTVTPHSPIYALFPVAFARFLANFGIDA
jgi:hypothetical protein